MESEEKWDLQVDFKNDDVKDTITLGQSPTAIDDEVYDEMLNSLRANMILK